MFLARLSIQLRRKTWLAAVAAGMTIFAGPVGAEASDEPGASSQEAAAAENEQLEKALQGLSWEQFKTVVEAIPKLKADVDAYGPLGWQYVQANYRTYPWRKNIRKLHEPQKKRLAELIDGVRDGIRPVN